MPISSDPIRVGTLPGVRPGVAYQPPVRTIYAGGPVDYGQRERTHGWRHDLAAAVPGWEVYCPICANSDQPDLDTLMRRNEIALYRSDRGVFLLDGLFTVGTPIEIAMKVEHGPYNVAIVNQAGEPGAFLKVWQRMGVTLLSSMSEVPEWLEKQ